MVRRPGTLCPAAGCDLSSGTPFTAAARGQFAAGDGAEPAAAFPRVRKEPSSAMVVISGAGNSTVVFR
jgi:hypothetical protein